MFVDLGLFFFTLANAGVVMEQLGALTTTIFLSLLLGKFLGIVLFTVVADKAGVAPMPDGMVIQDLLMIGFLASVGLTVALFISGEAYATERLQSEAKMGALLSGLGGVGAFCISKTPLWQHHDVERKQAITEADLIDLAAKQAIGDAAVKTVTVSQQKLLDAGARVGMNQTQVDALWSALLSRPNNRQGSKGE